MRPPEVYTFLQHETGNFRHTAVDVLQTSASLDVRITKATVTLESAHKVYTELANHLMLGETLVLYLICEVRSEGSRD